MNHDVRPGCRLVEAQSVGKTGNEDHRHSGVVLAQLADELDAVHFWHLVIGNHNVEALFAALFQRLLPGRAGVHLVPEFLEHRAAGHQAHAVVIDDQYVSKSS